MIEELKLSIDWLLPLILILRCLYFVCYTSIHKQNINVILLFPKIPRPFYSSLTIEDNTSFCIVLLGIFLYFFDLVFFIAINPLIKTIYLLFKLLRKMFTY